MASTREPKLIVIPPEGGVRLGAFGSTTHVKLGGEQTDGTLSLMTAQTEPGEGPPLHVHHSDDELFIVLQGEISFYDGTQWIVATPGTVVYAPREVPHAFRNTGATPSRHVVLTTPSGFEQFYTRASELLSRTGPSDRAALQQLSAEFGYEVLGPAPDPPATR